MDALVSIYGSVPVARAPDVPLVEFGVPHGRLHDFLQADEEGSKRVREIQKYYRFWVVFMRKWWSNTEIFTKSKWPDLGPCKPVVIGV